MEGFLQQNCTQSSFSHQCKAVKIPAAKQSSKEDVAEQKKPALGMFTHIYMSLLQCF